MRLFKMLLAIAILPLAIISCSKSDSEPSLAGKWTITGAVGNDDRHWTGSFTLKQSGSNYTGLFLWDAVDRLQTGTDSVAGTYNAGTKVLTLKSVAITGNIELVTYTANVTDNGTKMDGIWTGSSDGSIEDPGRWTAEKQ